jgi:thiosulfate/3-mercaptopyruvate sulfurtransferase
VPSYPNSDLLVSTDWLAANLSNPSVKVVDSRGAPRYAEGHIPGAVNLPVARLDDPTSPVRSMPHPAERIATVFGNAGLKNDDHIVIYDDGPALMASRQFWVLELYGHKKVGILDGGITRWIAENRDISREATQVTASSYTATLQRNLLATRDDVKAAIGTGTVLLDVRSPAEYTGAEAHSARGGHIPGAKNVNWEQTLGGMNIPAFKTDKELTELYDGAGLSPEKTVITYCQGGVRAAHSFYVLRLLGYDNVSNYTGSWGEWGNDPSLPAEK